MKTNPCVVLGGGGHARVVIECLRLSEAAEPVAILDRDLKRWGSMLDEVVIRGGDELLAELQAEGVVVFTVGLGDGPRARLFALGSEAGLEPVSAIHPSAIISPRAKIGRGVQIFALGAINPGAQLGDNVIINTGAIVEHDCIVEAHAHISVGACLTGGVRVGEGAFVGAGSVVRQGIRIGAGAIVGAGAVVIRDVPPGTVVAGVPARLLSERQKI